MKKQSLDERFNTTAVNFIKHLLEDQLNNQITLQVDVNFLKNFNRVLIGDSTRFDVPREFKDQLPGFSGKPSSAAGVSIQYEFDIKNGKVEDLNIGPAVTSDSKYVTDKKEDIQKGDLYIRDLGYYSTPLLSYIDNENAFYLSRLNAKVNVYQKIEDEYVLVSFNEIYSKMSKQEISQKELCVYIGSKEKLPVRLFIQVVPDEVYSKRLRKLEYYNKHNGHKTSQEVKDRMKLNLYITNISPDCLSFEQAILLYKIRWQIELRFKIWKSVFNLDKQPKMKYNRYLCLLYSRLLLVFIYYEMLININVILYNKTKKLLSLNKCFKTIIMNPQAIVKIIHAGPLILYIKLQHFLEIFSERHWLESKKNKVGYNEIFESFICK